MPELAPGYRRPPPALRPVGLRRRSVAAGTQLWRVEAAPFTDWSWTGFASPRHRFDPASGTFRTRYAGRLLTGAFRERYRGTGLVIPADHTDHHLIRLTTTRPLRVLDLRTERNLDLLQVDDQISTGQHPAVWHSCQLLADAVRQWWPDLDGIVYRSRTTPESSLNVAFFGPEAFTATSWTLAARPDVLGGLVLRHGFTVGWEL